MTPVEPFKPLIQFHREEIEHLSETDPRRTELQQSLETLRFAQALERKQTRSVSVPLPKQIVVAGPTQSGKSTLINLLLGLDQAGVSELAGYTVHCQGFAVESFDQTHLKAYFPEGSLVDQRKLQRELLQQYSCTYVGDIVSADSRDVLTDAVVWDTPDFDSVAQRSYRSPLFETLALADVVVMIVSKEKYADKSVWDVLKMLSVAGKDAIVVVNKASTNIREELERSVHRKLDALNAADGSNFTPSVYFIDEVEEPLRELRKSSDLISLRAEIAQTALGGNATVEPRNVNDVVRHYWQDWTLSVSRIHDNQRTWRETVEQSCDELLRNYQKEYLDSKRHDETLRLAVAELLVLLEIPGLAEPLTKIRNLVTWPMRKVLSAASARTGGITHGDNRREEQRLLESLFDHCLTGIAASVANRQHAASAGDVWWQSLQAELQQAKPVIKQGWENESENYQMLLKVETERAARSLYQKLEEQPATLNSLRAARVSADAAAVVLAVKSGGLGAADLVIAPAVLSLTTMLTESALGQYMNKVQQDLRRYQKKSVSSLVGRKLKMKLQAIGGSAPVGISPDQLTQLAEGFQLDLRSI